MIKNNRSALEAHPKRTRKVLIFKKNEKNGQKNAIFSFIYIFTTTILLLYYVYYIIILFFFYLFFIEKRE